MKFQGHHFPFNLNFILFLKIISLNTMYGMLLLFLMCNKKLDESRNFVGSFITLLLMSNFCNKRYFVFCFMDTKVDIYATRYLRMNGMKPSSSSGSQSSFIKPLASSLVNFSPKIIREMNMIECISINISMSTVHAVKLSTSYRDWSTI